MQLTRNGVGSGSLGARRITRWLDYMLVVVLLIAFIGAIAASFVSDNRP